MESFELRRWFRRWFRRLCMLFKSERRPYQSLFRTYSQKITFTVHAKLHTYHQTIVELIY